MTPSFPTRRSSDLANMGRNDIRRGKSDIAPKRVRIAVLAYPGAQRAAIHGLIDLFETASRLAAGAKPRTTFVATEWAVEDCRGRRGDGLAAIILPPILVRPNPTMDAAPIRTRLRARHDDRSIDLPASPRCVSPPEK